MNVSGRCPMSALVRDFVPLSVSSVSCVVLSRSSSSAIKSERVDLIVDDVVSDMGCMCFCIRSGGITPMCS